jgi:murein L,D-transpeptidase YafK
MLLRSILLTVMIVIGGAAPWLMRDWLRGDLQADMERTLQNTWGGYSGFDEANPPPGVPAGPKSEDALPPYPLAQATQRIMQSVLSRTEGADPALVTASLPLASEPAPLGAGALPKVAKMSMPTSVGASAETERRAVPSELESLGLSVGDPVFLRLFKKEQELELWMQAQGQADFTLFRVYRLQASSLTPGPKRREGDRLIPEGFYYQTITQYRALEKSAGERDELDLGYPNDRDRLDPDISGTAVLAVGASKDSVCLLSSSDMAEIKTMIGAAFSTGQQILRIHLFPFRMSDEMMGREWNESSPTADFWMNLKEGYDFFENAGFPPSVTADAAGYHFSVP